MQQNQSAAGGPASEKKVELQEAQRVRGGEPPRLWYRSDRIFCVDGGWYFHTREGVDVGPYNCHFDAELEAGVLLSKLQQNDLPSAAHLIREHMLDGGGGAGALNTSTFTDYLVASGGIEVLQHEAKKR